MSQTLYRDLSEVCHLFYEQYFPHEKIARKVSRLLRERKAESVLFIGGLTRVALLLKREGYDLSLADYTPEMLKVAKQAIGKGKYYLADMRDLRIGRTFDAVVAIGRSFTYMHTQKDALAALNSFSDHLKAGGILIFDNYETTRIEKGAYFAGTLKTQAKGIAVRRVSTIRLKKRMPSLYVWDCLYETQEAGKVWHFKDRGHILRAFSKTEIEGLIKKSELQFVAHHANFERRSFLSVAMKKEKGSKQKGDG